MYLFILVIIYYFLNVIIFSLIHKTKTKKTQYRQNDTIVSFINNSNIYKPLLSSSDEIE